MSGKNKLSAPSIKCTCFFKNQNLNFSPTGSIESILKAFYMKCINIFKKIIVFDVKLNEKDVSYITSRKRKIKTQQIYMCVYILKSGI